MTDIYKRVIPRDFFNEALLLKSMGLLALKIQTAMIPPGIQISIEEEDDKILEEEDDKILEYEGFNIKLYGEAGILYVDNYNVFINKKNVFIGTVYNSKRRYPLVAYHNNCEIEVFDEEGGFTEAFITTFKKKGF